MYQQAFLNIDAGSMADSDSESYFKISIHSLEKKYERNEIRLIELNTTIGEFLSSFIQEQNENEVIIKRVKCGADFEVKLHETPMSVIHSFGYKYFTVLFQFCH